MWVSVYHSHRSQFCLFFAAAWWNIPKSPWNRSTELVYRLGRRRHVVPERLLREQKPSVVWLAWWCDMTYIYSAYSVRRQQINSSLGSRDFRSDAESVWQPARDSAPQLRNIPRNSVYRDDVDISLVHFAMSLNRLGRRISPPACMLLCPPPHRRNWEYSGTGSQYGSPCTFGEKKMIFIRTIHILTELISPDVVF